MTQFLSDADVRAALDVGSLVGFLADRLAADALTGPRLNVSSGRAFVRLGGAIVPGAGGVVGFKAFHAGDGGGVRYLVALADLASGELLALVDGAHLTAVRTGAVTAVATDVMALPDAEDFAVIGSGEEAWSNLRAVCCVRTPRRVAVFSPQPARREAFAARVRRELGAVAVAAGSPQSAVGGAQVVIVATNTRRLADPIAFRADLLEPGVHVNSIGSTTPALRELDERVLLDADVVVVDSRHGAKDESGDMQAALAAGFDLDGARELGEVLRSESAVRSSDAEVTVFKSVGTAIQDVATAEWVVAECTRRGLGTKLDLELYEKTMEL